MVFFFSTLAHFSSSPAPIPPLFIRKEARQAAEEEFRDLVTKRSLEATNKVAEMQRKMDKKDADFREEIGKHEKRELDQRHENLKLRMQVGMVIPVTRSNNNNNINININNSLRNSRQRSSSPLRAPRRLPLRLSRLRPSSSRQKDSFALMRSGSATLSLAHFL